MASCVIGDIVFSRPGVEEDEEKRGSDDEATAEETSVTTSPNGSVLMEKGSYG